MTIANMQKQIGDWAGWLREENEADVADLRRDTRTGHPCGSDTFVRGLATALGRSLASRGRRITSTACEADDPEADTS